jgi:type II restriction enzyme
VTREDEARAILAALGMPPRQQNPNAVYTFLAFADVGPKGKWKDAEAVRRTPHDVIAFADEAYGKKYAENTRETIRRQAIHQFVQGGVLGRNPDDPTLATNSPRTHYALTSEALTVARAYGTARFDAEVATFLAQVGGGLAQKYAGRRKAHRVPVTLANGIQVQLSPGKHNRLQAAIVEDFLPKFGPGTVVLYLGDTDHKTLIHDKDTLAKLGIPVSKHDKLPDVVAHDARRGWLFLIEAVTSHGPVSPKRHVELEGSLTACTAGRVYVSAFPDFSTFKRYAQDIAWETEVWIASAPDHLLHYNGDRFFGPR